MRRPFASIIAFALAAVFALAAQSGDPTGAAGVRADGYGSFAFGIGNGMLKGDAAAVADRLGDYDLVVVDGEEAKAVEVAALQAEGAEVLAYLSVGTIEKWRRWYPRVKRYRLAAWQNWRDEWFADVSKRGLRRKLRSDIAPGILSKGFDGLFLDNVDMIEQRRHRTQRAGMRKLVRSLAKLTHSDGGLLFAQNGFWGLERFGIMADGALDGWNREDVTWTYDFDRKRYAKNRQRDIDSALDELRAMRDLGLVTTATDYTKHSAGSAVDESVANACSVGALPFVGDFGLTAKRLPPTPWTCP